MLAFTNFLAAKDAGGASGGIWGNFGESGGTITNPALGSLGNQSGGSFFQKFIPAAINLAFVIGAIIFVFMLITGGIQWISSGGEKTALESARSRITNALVGLIILFAAYAVLNFVGRFFGINILTLDIGSLAI